MTYHTLIDAAALRQWLARSPVTPRLAIVDCRFDLGRPDAGRLQYLAGHIAGARYADLNADLSGPVTPSSGRHPLPAPTIFAATLARLGIEPGIQVVVYDAANGAFAARLWWMLRTWGHTQVAVLDGGYPAWLAAGAPTVAGEELPAGQPPRPPTIEAWPVVSTAQVAQLRDDPNRLLIDARATERYAGASEPIDSAAGHVPGAVNHPFSLNLAADGRFLTAGELRSRWLSLLDGHAPSEVVVMCGSGVTACHNLLGLEVAGLPGASLYAGSWSEWIRDAQRPIARGDHPRGGHPRGG